MHETQLREILLKGLPKIASAAASGIYPMGFQPQLVPCRDSVLDSQVVASQLIYTKNIHVVAFLTMDSEQIIKLGQQVFSKSSRLDSSKTVISANGEILNTIMAKLGYLIGKIDNDTDMTITPPIVINCSGDNRISIHGSGSIFLNLASGDFSMRVISSIQMV